MLPDTAFKAGSAGAVNISGPNGAMTMDVNNPYSQLSLGPISAIDPPNPNIPLLVPTFLTKGNYTVSAPGAAPLNGIPVGSLNAQIGVPDAVDFTNRYSLAQLLDRTQPVAISWTGGDPNGYVLISGISFSAIPAQTGPHSEFFCVERASTGQFTIPNYVVLSMPVSFFGQTAGLQFGVAVGQVGVSRFSASGLDTGLLRYNVSIGRSLGWK